MENRVNVGGTVMGSINFAMQQNYVPIVRHLVVHNETEEKLTDLTLKITFEPEFAADYRYEIAQIEPGGSVEIRPVRIRLKTDFLFSLTEKMVGAITFAVYSGEERLFCHEDSIELLAYNQWSGQRIMPEMIAAFVTPNHPSVAAVVSEASVILEQWTGSTSFTGYQTQNPNHVKLQMAALYTALQNRGIIYNNPPASFENAGQRVRLPHEVLEQRQGTCLDLAVLYVSCMEAVGLNPLILIIEGHAFAGCWLERQTFADCAVDDVSAIEKRIVTGAEELLLAECTDLVSGKGAAFDRAVKHGKDHLIDPHRFRMAVDIRRCRGSGIRPIPLRLEQSDLAAEGDSGDTPEQTGTPYLPEELDTSLMGRVAERNDPVTRQKLWERKLLDFSLRNALLNFRPTRRSLQFMTSDLSELEDQLADGRDFRIMEIPSEWTVTLRDSKIYEIENGRDLIRNIASEELKSGRLRTFLDEKMLDVALKTLYRTAKMSMEENGSNTLFLALGFLRWFESDLSERARYAPIVLIPVDIVRNVRSRGYVIRSRQEEAQVNITLLEYLRQDHSVNITGLDPLPEDEHGIDLPLIFNTVRQAVMGKKRWNVEEMAFVGIFSFGQFVMWNDLRSRAGELAENKVVSSLMKGAMTWEPEPMAVTPENLDETVSVGEMAIPVSADSSQMAAIAAAAAGQSFVLHGPPGTGKSQTITNMIANALYQGKSVLFVAEKMAALSVVQKRLADIGLDPFCLELHSNKTNKTAVLGELNKALEVGRIRSPEDYEATAAKVHELRQKLNDVITALHVRRGYGVSLYEAIERFEQVLPEKGKIGITRSDVVQATESVISRWNDLLRAYQVAAKAIGVYAEHPLRDYHDTEYSIELREALKGDLTALRQEADKTAETSQALCRRLGISGRDKRAVYVSVNLATAALMEGEVWTELLGSPSYETLRDRIRQLVMTGRRCETVEAELKETFEPSVLDYPVETAKRAWKEAETAWLIPKLLGQNRLLRELKLYAKDTASVTRENITDHYAKLTEYAELKATLRDAPKELTGMMGGLYLGTQTDWGRAESSLNKTESVHQVFAHVERRERDSVLSALSDGGTEEVHEWRTDVYHCVTAVNALTERHRISTQPLDSAEDYWQAVSQLTERYLANLSRLREIAAYNQAEGALKEANMGKVCQAYRSGRVELSHLQAAFQCDLYYQLTLLTIGEDPRLAAFHGKQYDDLVRQYHEAIDRYQRLTVQELVAKLSARVPSSGIVSAASSEMGILKRAIKSNGRMMSLRRLFDQIPTLLRKLCPCMLMSPISVAQYIDPSFPKFDIVIFDEASQLPTSEAVGTIARGENAVIVGDPKQLPPTNFFSSNRIDEENSDMEELESLLDDCLAISMPQTHLKWHYRSRHESLIAYSNLKYYENKLYTFPSPSDLTSEVKLVHVDGVYDKGRTKQNRAEAEAIVAEIVRRLTDETLRRDSIGVVTFSSVQQNLIEDLLEEQFQAHPELDELDRASPEPIFIKNLENVQGDERDVILFSVGYGPDAEGKVSMNFGPLNRTGGWRRLNVAISRARKQMIVYAVITPDQIDLNRTRAEGVAGLKGFLEFAQRGKNVLASNAAAGKTREDYMAQEIAESVRRMGYDVRCNIGCSQFKVDIGVVDPDDPDTYLLGILLDGENCNAAATARDRFVLQPDVLGGLGWNTMRVWTLDWLDDPEYVKSEIRQEIERLQTAKTETPAPEPPAPKQEPLAALSFEQEKAPVTVAVPYNTVSLATQGSAEQFYLPQTGGAIYLAMKDIMEGEAPISQRALMRKVLAAWGISRGGSRVESIFMETLAYLPNVQTKDDGRVFLWQPDQVPEAYAGYRVADRNGNRRGMDDVPSQEIRNAIAEVLREQVSLSETDLIRETAKKFGFTRLGSVIENTIRYAIGRAILSGTVSRLENGNLVLKD